jgi:hypothetical protein
MQRRTLLRLGLGGAVVLAVGGGLVTTVRPGWRAGRLTTEGRQVFGAVSRAVVPSLSNATPEALERQLAALEVLVAGLPRAMQSELAELLALAASLPGRRFLVGLEPPWAFAKVAETAQALESMRRSDFSLRVQAYQALRELALAAHHADPASWVEIGYPGPLALG